MSAMRSTAPRPTPSSEASGPRPTERRSVAERRKQLVDAAASVITEDGLTQATTRAITDRAGLALGAFHYAFDSKDELLEAVIEAVTAEIAEELDASFAATRAAEEPGKHQVAGYLADLLTRFWGHVRDEPQLQLAQYELTLYALRTPGMHHLADRQYDAFVALIADALARVAPDADRRGIDDLARHVVAITDGLIWQRLVQDDTDAAQRRLTAELATLDVLVEAYLGS